MAPASDMFEMGVKVQVLKRGTMFAMRGQKLYEVYQKYESIDEIPEPEREKLETTIFKQSLDSVWNECEKFFNARDPKQIERAMQKPKDKMALIFRWYLGQAAGTAVADVLFGDVNPGGKLPITFPRAVGQIPAYYYHKPSGRRGYLFADEAPLFCFGHGLSYTTFAYRNLRLSANSIHAGERVTLTVEVTNTGERAGDVLRDPRGVCGARRAAAGACRSEKGAVVGRTGGHRAGFRRTGCAATPALC